MAENMNKYAFLEQMTTEQLKTLIRIDSEVVDGFETELILYALDILVQREDEDPNAFHPDVEKALQEFWQYYYTPDCDGKPLYDDGESEEFNPAINSILTPITRPGKTVRLRRVLRTGLVAVIAIILLFGGMITAHAAGVDIFGALGRWTEETFHFIVDSGASGHSNSQHKEYHDAIQEQLLEIGLTEDLAPKWYPKGYELLHLEIKNNETYDVVSATFCDTNGDNFTIDFMRRHSGSIENLLFEKDDGSVEQYNANGRTFYIMSNLNFFMATWASSNGQVAINISISDVRDIKSIIDSIGGPH